MKKKFYVTVDTETCTLSFVNEWNLSAKDKQKIAIAKPLVYDLGWVVSDRQGNIIKTRNYLIQETFFVPNVFNTAYYKNKRPIYMELLAKGEIEPKCWKEAFQELLEDMENADMTCAYNVCFDYKKAIPFTDNYINHLYSNDYDKWEYAQRKSCESILKGKSESHNEDYLKPYVNFNGNEYPICDLWGVACERLINIDKYRNYCLENRLISHSAEFFKSSAETSFQYLMKNYEFIEDHTALSDALIEKEILTKALKKGKIEPYIKEFPFRTLGTTFNYVAEKKPKYKDALLEMLEMYIEESNAIERAENGVGYYKRILKEYNRLQDL